MRSLTWHKTRPTIVIIPFDYPNRLFYRSLCVYGWCRKEEYINLISAKASFWLCGKDKKSSWNPCFTLNLVRNLCTNRNPRSKIHTKHSSNPCSTRNPVGYPCTFRNPKHSSSSKWSVQIFRHSKHIINRTGPISARAHTHGSKNGGDRRGTHFSRTHTRLFHYTQ